MIEARYIPDEGFMIFLNGLGKMKAELGGIKHNLIEKSARDLADIIRRNIDTQKYASSFAPLSPEWEKYKKLKGKNDDFWRFMGTLYKNIMAVQLEENEWTVMIMNDVSSDGKDPAWYGTILETGKQKGGKPRPLFFYSYRDFKETWNANCRTQFERIRKAVSK